VGKGDMMIKKAFEIVKGALFVGLIVHERSRLFTKGVDWLQTHELFKISSGKHGYPLTEEKESGEVIPDDNDGFITAVAEIKEVTSPSVVVM